jgi:hypothetical protein
MSTHCLVDGANPVCNQKIVTFYTVCPQNPGDIHRMKQDKRDNFIFSLSPGDIHRKQFKINGYKRYFGDKTDTDEYFIICAGNIPENCLN